MTFVLFEGEGDRDMVGSDFEQHVWYDIIGSWVQRWTSRPDIRVVSFGENSFCYSFGSVQRIDVFVVYEFRSVEFFIVLTKKDGTGRLERAFYYNTPYAPLNKIEVDCF